MPDRLNFSVTRTKDDYILAYRAFLLRGRILQAVWVLLGLFIAVNVLARTLAVTEGKYTGFSHWLDLAPLIFLYLVLLAFGFYFAPLRQARSHKDLGMVTDVIVNGNGITETNPLGSVRTNWAIFSEAREKRGVFLLSRGRVRLWVYPKRNISAETISRFRELLRTHVRKTQLRSPGSAAGKTVDAAPIEDSVTPPPTNAKRSGNLQGLTPEPLTFRMTSTKKDYIRGYRVYMWRSNLMRIMWLLLLLLVARAVYGSVSDLIAGLGVRSLLHDVVFYGGLFLFIYYVVPAWSVRNAAGFGEDYEVRVSEEGIEVNGSLASSRAVWENFTAAFETSEGFVVYQGSERFRVFPKRSLRTDDISRFRKLLADNISKVDLLETEI